MDGRLLLFAGFAVQMAGLALLAFSGVAKPEENGNHFFRRACGVALFFTGCACLTFAAFTDRNFLLGSAQLLAAGLLPFAFHRATRRSGRGAA